MSDINDLIKCYNENKDFKDYVDKCVKTYGKDVDHMLRQPITDQYYQYLNKIGDYDEHKPQRI